MTRFLSVLALAACTALAQEFHEMLKFEELKAKAEETVEVNLDGNMLRMAMAFLNDKKSDEAQVKHLLGNIKGIYVRSLKFGKPGQYSMADIDKIRAQVKAPQWQKMVDVQEKKGDNVGIYMRSENDKMTGLLVLAFEPDEFTVVNIAGQIDPAQLRALSGKMGIPDLNMNYAGGSSKLGTTKPAPKKKDGKDKDKDEDDDDNE